MTDLKKTNKSKLMAKGMGELLNESQFEKSAPKKKPQKRQRAEVSDEAEDFSKLVGLYQSSAKQHKNEASFNTKEPRNKLLKVMKQQQEARKHFNSNFMKSLSELISQIEADYEMLKENEQKLEHLASVFIKCIKQASGAQKQNLKSLQDIYTCCQKEVEGLLTRGALKPDDRPLWFDVYRAFPPITEPKFARPKPEIKPIRNILYHEDVVRAKFHSQGQGLGAVNMLNPAGDTHTKKLVQQYEKLKAEGVPESELVEKSVAAIGIERQSQQESISNPTPKNPDSVTAKVLAEADIKNIFKEEEK